MVIVIVGLLSSVLVPKIMSAGSRAINTANSINMRQTNNALMMYFYDKGSYPSAPTCSNGVKTDCSLSSLKTVLASYVSSLPKTSYSIAGGWIFGSGYLVPTANEYGYVGLGPQYILTYQFADTRDNSQYRVVTMPDGQIRMAQNLNYSSSDAVCYGGSSTNCTSYGKLYTWDDAQTACPVGWHLTSNGEWVNLINQVQIAYQPNPWKVLEATANGGIDTLGLSISLAGYRIGNGQNRSDLGTDGYYWTTDQNGSYITFDGTSITTNSTTHNKNTYHSVRCVLSQ